VVLLELGDCRSSGAHNVSEIPSVWKAEGDDRKRARLKTGHRNVGPFVVGRDNHMSMGHAMKHLVTTLTFICCAFPDPVVAQSNAPTPILADNLRWVSPPNNPALQGVWLLGAEQKPELYILRVKLAAGGRIPPHTHPDERNSTVLSGTIYVGFGETFDETKVVAIPAGAVYVAPANIPHYVWAKDGDAVYQEAGVGPTGTSFIKR
jgi:quercetin dioxygenase-like cupin family protein